MRRAVRRWLAGLVAAVSWVVLGGVAAADVSVVATLVSADGGQARTLVDITPVPAGPLPDGAITVSAGSAPVPVTATPLLADSLALGLVVDASSAGAAALPQGLSGAANLVLQLPPAAAVGVVTDASPPKLLASPSPGPTATLTALDKIRAGGARRTGTALSTAARLLPDTPGPRVLVLYTGAADAGGMSAADLTSALVQQNVVLAVVSTSTDPAYWSAVATATGGAVVPTNPANAIGAFSTVAELLRTRYQLTFTLPQPAPRSVTISVDTGTGRRTAQASVTPRTPPPPAAPRTDSNSGTLRLAILVAVAVLVLANIIWLLIRAARGRRRRPPPSPAAAPAPAPDPPADPPAGERWGDEVAATLRANPLPVYSGPEEPLPAPADSGVGVPVPAAADGAGGEPRDDKVYMLLDATVAEASAAVEAGRLDAAHAVAQIALAAPGRVDLIDRRATSEARLARASQAIWPPPVRVLRLLREARAVSTGQTALSGPNGVEVRQDGATLVLTRRGEWVCDCDSAAELADHVDVDSLAAAVD
jgi:von Willebrand factor type A domain